MGYPLIILLENRPEVQASLNPLPIILPDNGYVLVHLSRRLKCTRCPSVLPSLTFHIFDFSPETTAQNSTKLDRKQELNILYQVCVFWVNQKNKMAALASDWPRHFRLLWNRWMEFNETWQEARSQCLLPSLYFSGRSEKQDGRPDLWLVETFSTSPLKPLNGIQRNLTRSKNSTSSTKYVFFGLIGKTRWPPWPLISWDIFDFSSETAERNSTKLDRKQDLNVLYQVCVFRADGKKQDGRPSLWLAEIFSTSPLKPLNEIQRNLTGSKISTSSTKFVFFGPISKQKCPPWSIRHIVLRCTICGPLGLLFNYRSRSQLTNREIAKGGSWLINTFVWAAAAKYKRKIAYKDIRL